MKQIITIVAFKDDQPNSVAYKKFDGNKDLNKVISFYARQLTDDNVKVISTRKVVKNENSKTY